MKLNILLTVILTTAAGVLVSFGLLNVLRNMRPFYKTMWSLLLAAACGYVVIKL